MKKKIKKYQGNTGSSQVKPIQSKPSVTPADTTSQKSTSVEKIKPSSTTKPATTSPSFYRQSPTLTFKGKSIVAKKKGGAVKKKGNGC